LPIVIAIGTGRIEIKVTMIRMKKHVGTQIVIVPHESTPKVFTNGMLIDKCKILPHDKPVE
jgi:hypothetical protein